MNISDYRVQFASFNSALDLDRFNHHVGLKSEPNSYEIYDRYSDLFSTNAIADLSGLLAQTPADFETEKAGLRRLLGAAQLRHVEMQANELTNELVHCESSARIEWNGERISLGDAAARLASESNKTARSELAARFADAILICQELRIARLESFCETARALGLASFGALVGEVTNTNLASLQLGAQSLLEQTEAAYTSALAGLIARDYSGVTLQDLDFADLPYFESMPWLGKDLSARDPLRTYAETLEGLGIRIDKQSNLEIDSESRPSRNLAAACFAVSPPDDVRLAISYHAQVHDSGFLFQAGKAQHYAWCSRDLAKRNPEFVHSPDHATTEASGYLFSYLPVDPRWQLEFLRGINQSRAGEIARDLRLQLAMHIRRLCADVLYGVLSCAADQHAREQLRSAYLRLHERATSFRARPELILLNVWDPMHSASRLRALAFAVGLWEYLRVRHGHRWWASRKAGDELIDLWNTASRYSVEELARLFDLGELNFDLLADAVITGLNGV